MLSLMLIVGASTGRSFGWESIAVHAQFGQRNEKITGNKATTEIKDDKDEWSSITFFREGGVWKVSLE